MFLGKLTKVFVKGCYEGNEINPSWKHNPHSLLAKKRIIMLTSPPKKVGGIFQFPKPHFEPSHTNPFLHTGEEPIGRKSIKMVERHEMITSPDVILTQMSLCLSENILQSI